MKRRALSNDSVRILVTLKPREYVFGIRRIEEAKNLIGGERLEKGGSPKKSVEHPTFGRLTGEGRTDLPVSMYTLWANI